MRADFIAVEDFDRPDRAHALADGVCERALPASGQSGEPQNRAGHLQTTTKTRRQTKFTKAVFQRDAALRDFNKRELRAFVVVVG
jgi:hypothetical protein